MSVIFYDGFDLYNSTYPGTGKFVNMPPAFSTGRFGVGQCVNASNATIRWAFDAISTLSVGFAFKMSSTGSDVLRLLSSSTTIAGLRVESTGAVKVYRGDFSTLLGTSAAGVIAPATWYYLEIEYVRDSGSSGVFKVYVNGVEVLSLTGINSGSTNIDGISWYYGGEYWFDDMYTTNTATRLGECRVDTLRPTADTADKDWTASTGSDNYAMVDDTTLSSSDYVTAGSAGAKDYYQCADLSFDPLTIHAVQMTSLAKKDDATTRTYRNKLKSSSSEASGATRGLSTSYAVYSDILATNPDGSVAWTQTAVNAAQVGIEVVS